MIHCQKDYTGSAKMRQCKRFQAVPGGNMVGIPKTRIHSRSHISVFNDFGVTTMQSVVDIYAEWRNPTLWHRIQNSINCFWNGVRF